MRGDEEMAESSYDSHEMADHHLDFVLWEDELFRSTTVFVPPPEPRVLYDQDEEERYGL
jgi:hypothetical protein